MNWNSFAAVTRQGTSFTGGYVAGVATVLMLAPEKIIAASQAVHQLTNGLESLGVLLGPAMAGVMSWLAAHKASPIGVLTSVAALPGTKVVTTPELADATPTLNNVVSSAVNRIVSKS
jgi:hypothetical protein